MGFLIVYLYLLWTLICFRLEGNENLVLTPFEKNLDIWRQLWRVLERSDLVKVLTFCLSALHCFSRYLVLLSIEVDETKN